MEAGVAETGVADDVNMYTAVETGVVETGVETGVADDVNMYTAAETGAETAVEAVSLFLYCLCFTVSLFL